ncbi:FFLEELY motif protein [Marilutibacter chinensis]|uniref:DUF8198 domain-containing protein n=1 Tax=Marilutibacter chinensis TaxID=2912247 RepID=A0ABS9HQY3_9GAMM|nr:hypothetical protein [Lysobacter chinensis]MCF7220565.1 hypothetical protein [Lysobacter chinensis]
MPRKHRHHDAVERLARLLAAHQTLHDPQRDPRNGSRWLPELRRWQSARLEASFGHFLDDPRRRPAANFFLSDVYADKDFSRRDADIARVLPMMQKLLPTRLLAAVADAIELGLLTHALDLRMAVWLERNAARRKTLDVELYARAYRATGLPRVRGRQIDLIVRAGFGLAQALKTPGVTTLLRLSRGPARAAGLDELQAFLERGAAAFAQLGDVRGFVAEIERDEREVSRRLFAAEPDPFGPGASFS